MVELRAGAEVKGVRLVDASAMAPGEWDDLAARSPRGEAFQSHAWGELKRGLGWTPLRCLVELHGSRVAAVFVQERPLTRLPLTGAYRLHYAPRGPILLDDREESVHAALAGLRQLARRRRSLALTIDPAWEEGSALAATLEAEGFQPAIREIQVSRTGMIIPVQPTDEAQHALLGDSTARNVNKARRAGVTAERVPLADAEGADESARNAALEEFFEMHAETGRREGFLVRDRAYDLDQWRRLGRDGIASLWFAGLGRRDTGVVLLQCGRLLLSHAAGSREDADTRRTRANHLLQWEILRWAAGHGFSGYDLGGVDTQDAPGIPQDESHPLWNLFEFKRGWGATPVLHVRAHEYSPGMLSGRAWRLARRFR